MKKFISVFMAVLLCGALVGCGNGSETEKPGPEEPETQEGMLKALDEVPVYTDGGEKMLISFMNEMRPTAAGREQAWQIFKDSGINTFHSWGHSTLYEEMCEKYGIDYMPYVYANEPNGSTYNIDPENLSDCFVGFGYYDEPAYNMIDTFIPLAENHKQYFPDEYFYVNLHPCWFEDEYEPGKTLDGHNYTEYVAHYCDTIFSIIEENRFLSVDVYPLYATSLRDAYLYTYENIAEYAKAYDATFHFYLATTQHGAYRKTNYENLRFTINVAMTYGGQAMSYFTYVMYEGSTGFSHGMVSPDGLTTYEEYDIVKQINSECLSWDHVFLNFNWEETMCLEGTTGNANSQYERLQFNVDSIDIIKNVTASQDTLIGRFTGKDGEIGLMVTNFTDPIEQRTDQVELELYEANKAIVYVRGVPTVYDLEDGKLTLDILPGDAAFVIPVEIKE